MNMVDLIEKENLKEKIPEFEVGDIVDVHVKLVEGDKERIQIFNGIVIAKKGTGVRETFTVRRIVQGEGVERVFPIHSPNVKDIKVKKSHKIRRAKLYYLRERSGKSARLKEKFVGKTKGKGIKDKKVKVQKAKDKETKDKKPKAKKKKAT
jgi:large subunit ribosomal protein L19